MGCTVGRHIWNMVTSWTCEYCVGGSARLGGWPGLQCDLCGPNDEHKQFNGWYINGVQRWSNAIHLDQSTSKHNIFYPSDRLRDCLSAPRAFLPLPTYILTPASTTYTCVVFLVEKFILFSTRPLWYVKGTKLVLTRAIQEWIDEWPTSWCWLLCLGCWVGRVGMTVWSVRREEKCGPPFPNCSWRRRGECRWPRWSWIRSSRWRSVRGETTRMAFRFDARQRLVRISVPLSSEYLVPSFTRNILRRTTLARTLAKVWFALSHTTTFPSTTRSTEPGFELRAVFAPGDRSGSTSSPSAEAGSPSWPTHTSAVQSCFHCLLECLLNLGR